MYIIVEIAVIGLLLAGGGEAGDNGGTSPPPMDSKCMAVLGCISEMSDMSGMGTPAGGSGGNGNMLDMSSSLTGITMMCGPVKGMLDCMEGLHEDCDTIMTSLKENIENGATVSGMNYEKIKDFISNTCPRMPGDFGTNTCVKDRMSIPHDDECMQKAGQGMQEGAEPTCSDVEMMVRCMSLEMCGRNYDVFMRESMSFFFSASLNKNCDLTKTSDSYRLKASIFTIAIAVLSLLKLV